jgi:tRNA (guanine-N7-)-methyltransferase
LNGLAKAVAAIDEHRLENVRLFAGDATLLLDWLPAAALERVDILYPDPWPKRRHWKRRFVSAGNLDRLARTIAPGGLLRVATDVAAYADWTLLRLGERGDFIWTAERADDWRKPFPGWRSTRYEQKALAAGRTPTYLAFRR